MKLKLLLVVLSLTLATTGEALGWGNDDRLNRVENELHQQRQKGDGLVIVVGVLGIGSIILFGIGAAIGSKARKEVTKNE